jgi:hypothetical protein
MPKSHSTMSLVCLRYLLMSDLATPLQNSPGSQERSFLPYAAVHWPLHHISHEDAIADQLRKDARTLCNVAGEARVWAPDYFPREYLRWRSWTDLILASFLGLRLVVEDMLAKDKIYIDAQGGYYGTALQAASVAGHKEIVEKLLGKGADVDAQGGSMGRDSARPSRRRIGTCCGCHRSTTRHIPPSHRRLSPQAILHILTIEFSLNKFPITLAHTIACFLITIFMRVVGIALNFILILCVNTPLQ